MRVIHRFDFKGLDVVKGINFEGLRPVAKIQNLVSAWRRERIGELHFQGALTSLHDTQLDHKIVRIAKQTLLRPITVGGGIKNLDSAQKLISTGADRIAINTAFFNNQKLYSALVDALGVSTVVVSIDVSKNNNEYYCFINNGRDNTNISLADYLARYQDQRCPEILVTNIDGDGICSGVDLSLVEILTMHGGPVVLSGGIKSTEDVEKIKSMLPNSSNGVSIGRAFHNFIREEIQEDSKSFAFASRFDVMANQGKKAIDCLEPAALTKKLNKGEF